MPKITLGHFPPARPKELSRKEKRWLTDVGHNSWWHMKHAQCAAQVTNSKRWDYSDIPGGGHKRFKDPPKWLKVATTLEKPSTPIHSSAGREASMAHQCGICATALSAPGWRTEPWCTPTPTPNSSVYWPLTHTWLWALWYMPWMTHTAHSSTPRLLKAYHRAFLGTQLEAFSRSTTTK